MDHDGITRENYIDLIETWLPYAKNDILSLAACVTLYNRSMKELIGQTMASSLTSSAITFKGFVSQTQEEGGEKIHSHIDPWTRKYIRRAVKGGRVSANIEKFLSKLLPTLKEKIQQLLNTDETCMVKLMQLYKPFLIEKLQNHFNTKETSMGKLLELYSRLDDETKDKISVELKDFNKDDLLMAFDATSLYPSAMFDSESEYPRCETAYHIKEHEKPIVLNLFNNQQFRPRCGIFSVLYEYPENLFFQPMPAKDKTVERSVKQNLDVIRFRNGVIYDVLCSVDIQEIVRCGGKIIKIYDGIIYRENFKQSPFRAYVKKLFELRLKYKQEGNKVGDLLVKLLLNYLYGKCVQKDIDTLTHLWKESTLEKRYTELIKKL